jgi:glycosyltransferase involved in cell wall biosynthesis
MTILNNSHWVSSIYGRSGYGEVNRAILKEMIKRKIHFSFESYDWDKGMTADERDYPKAEFKMRENLPKSHLVVNMDNIIHHRIMTISDTDMFSKQAREKNQIMMTVYEYEPAPPPTWIKGFNNYDLVITPSEYCKKIFSQPDMTTPIEVVNWGYDPNIYKEDYKEKFSDKRDYAEKPFTFLSVFQWGGRKSPYELINAYLQEFSGSDNTRLLLRTYVDGSEATMLTIARKIRRWCYKIHRFTGKTDFPFIQMVTNTLSNNALAHLYQRSDAYIHTARGEGFGLPVLETMACKTPAIATNFHAVGEFYKDEDFAIKGYKDVPMDDYYVGSIYDPQFGTRDKVPYIMEIREKMRKMFELSPEERRKKGEEQYESIKHMTWQRTVDQLEAINIEES